MDFLMIHAPDKYADCPFPKPHIRAIMAKSGGYFPVFFTTNLLKNYKECCGHV